MAIWGIDKVQARRVPPPVPALGESEFGASVRREAIHERLLLFQTGRALDSPLRFLAWAERKGFAHDHPELTLQRDEAARAVAGVKRILSRHPARAVEAQGARIPERAMDLLRPMKEV
jgi:hypothetical protein